MFFFQVKVKVILSATCSVFMNDLLTCKHLNSLAGCDGANFKFDKLYDLV